MEQTKVSFYIAILNTIRLAKLGSKSGSIRADQAEIADVHWQTPNTRSTT